VVYGSNPFCFAVLPFFIFLNFNKGGNNLEVKVVDNDVEKALKILKNKLSKSGLFKELKIRRAYEKPSVKQKRKSMEAQRRLAKVQRRRRG
jgi:small subunit ribosomal protein S21